MTTIGSCAFYDCRNLTSIEIGNNVSTIGKDAFYNTAWNVRQPNGLVYVGKVVYKYKGTMPKNTSIVLQYGTLGIAGEAFHGCGNLTSIEIPNSVTSIGEWAFKSCTGLTSINIPDGVTSISEQTFDGCTGLTSINIPDGVTYVGSRAFNRTAWYDNQPEGVVYVGKVAYKYKGTMPKNTSIVLRDGILAIADEAFQACSSMTSITIPNSVTSIGSLAFSNCRGLTSVTIPSSVTSIGSSAFSGCSRLTSIEIPNSVTSIKKWMFDDCTCLTSINIPNSVTTIGDYAFMNCTALTSLTIPNSVTSIGQSAFWGCSKLAIVKVYVEKPLSIDYDTFTNQTNATLYVPVGSKAAYDAVNWNEFKEIIEFNDGDINGDGEINGTDLVSIIDHIMGYELSSFVFAAADINGDGKVNGLDLVKTISLIMGQMLTVSSANYVKAKDMTLDSDNGLSLTQTGNGEFVLGNGKGNAYIMAQCMISLSEGLELESITADDQHQVTWQTTSDGRYAVLAYSTKNEAFADGLLTFHVKGQGTVSVEDVLLVDVDRQEARMKGVAASETTGIVPHSVDDKKGDIYNLNGTMARKAATPPTGLAPGIYIMNGKKVVIR